ncbi:uncharacterized protein K452DRAFT_357287 [Aplosporella prunicola CBS 121167]|uniref:Zn(2)-C6 fungal-type domain-containing protein n=1 Tax=Aplosporella prunicola CBS 121167 TaxID=1176127 RepID=A0A6A6BJX3_9PEZI|nr:uncharacterized protein K452DRAFT_357287 [Aplosporella prunicola CBS 121167]KAF2143635.1 hypothetical protein K452DRAFT_357287 [Aplosporella prunicola CBS 121167]
MRTDLVPSSEDCHLMVLETPLLRVSRPVAACSRCRSAKVKCDGKLPACTACERANRAAECSSTNDQFARGKERSYVATLEARVEKLEKRLAEIKARRQSSMAMDHEPQDHPPSRPSLAENQKPSDKKSARRKEESDINDLVSDFGLLSVNATARDFYGFTSAMSYARLILSASSKEPLPSGMTKQLPPRYAATPLIQHYLNSIFVLLPLLDESSFYASVDAVYHPDQRKASPFDSWTLRMVLAIASITLSEQRGDVHYTDALGHINAAMEHAESVLRPGSIASIQALLLLVQYAMLDPHHFDSWTLIGAASRAMVDLGMHVNPSRGASMSKPKLELRRRVYHCLYALDRETSLVQTRAFSFSDDSANVALPFSANSASASKSPARNHKWLQSYDSALDLFRLRQLQSEWYTNLFQSGREPWREPYPSIWRIYNSMASWFNNLSPNTSPATRNYFELELLYSYVYVLSPSPRCPRISDHAQRLIFEHCVRYASKMLNALSEESQSIKATITFYDAMRVYMTGRQFVDVLSRNQDFLLTQHPVLSPAASVSTIEEAIDPLAQGTETAPPPFPESMYGVETTFSPTQQTIRAISTITNFTSILARFGLRFGYINWRDRFQQESAALLAQLQFRSQQRTPDQGHRMWHSNGTPDGSDSLAGASPGSYFETSTVSHQSPQAFGYMDGASYTQQSPGWSGSGGASNRRIYTIGQVAVPGSLPASTAAPMAGDMGSEAAWETLPGGCLNARFS